jgi:hypothetical protein
VRAKDKGQREKEKGKREKGKGKREKGKGQRAKDRGKSYPLYATIEISTFTPLGNLATSTVSLAG